MLFLSAVLLTVFAQSSPSPGAWWVFFSDRGPDLEARLQNRTIQLEDSPSWERRTSAGLHSADELDLPPWPGYVNRVMSLRGPVDIRTESRFLNAVSVQAEEEQLREILRLPFVSHVQPVATSTYRMPPVTYHISSNVSLTDIQLQQIGLNELHSRGWQGDGIVVGLLDSGFNLEHEVFLNTIVLSMYDFVMDDDDPSQEPEDPPGQSDHGTAVLSVMGGFREGVFIGGAPQASFILAKTEDTGDEYQAEEDYWVQGLEWIEASGGYLVNSSLGYIDWYGYEDLDGNTAVTTVAADAAASRGMPVYNSVGNEGPDAGTLIAPADGDSVFASGAVDSYGNIAAFSSRGPTVDGRIKPDGCALGVGTVLAYKGTDQYSQGNGTSFASPLVASAAAALASAHPEWDMIRIMEILRLTASCADDPCNDYGYGIIDAHAALLYRSVTGRAVFSGAFEPAADYPLSLAMEDTAFVFETNSAGWFALCPDRLGDFILSGAGGEGSVIPVSGSLTESGLEITVYIDRDPSESPPDVYPNPSTEGVYVGFDLTEGPVDVSMTVFDITGQMVHRQTRSGAGPGSFRAPVPEEAFHWDGKCTDGSSAASGVYFILLDRGDDTDILKCSLVR